MARFDGGWIKLYRKAIEGDIGSNPVCLAIFVRLLVWAVLKPTTIRFNGLPREMPRGSLVLGIRELAQKVGCARETAYRHLLYLERRDTIHREVGTEGTLITVLNFDRYQSSERDVGWEPNGDGTQTGRGLGHGPDPSKEVKKRRSKIAQAFDLESAYQKYPRKEGKSDGLTILRKEIKTQKDFEDLKRAIENYTRDKAGIEKVFLKLFSSFAKVWREWIVPEGSSPGSPMLTFASLDAVERGEL